MCGLAGFTGFESNVEWARQANLIQSHRGPDNQTVWADEYLALAHLRLSIIDLSERANQPFHKGDYALIFNGEIYNYKDLQQRLVREKNILFQTDSDTEVILESYINYGEKCLDHFVGMFAFAIYNKVTHELFIARDHFGIKPLFYTKIGSAFAFASELKALVGIPGFSKEINSRSLVSSLNYLWVSGNESIFRNCFKLPPAHYLKRTADGVVTIAKYWELKERSEIQPEEEWIKKLSYAIEESVKRHMVADVPVSSFLSGGLDSSLVSVLSSQHNHHLSTYTIGMSAKDKRVEQMPDDQKYARLVAELHHFDHHEIVIDSDIVKMLPAMVRTLDEPIGDPAAINTLMICNAARKRGVKVLLSGMGADEIFGGYRRHKAMLLALKYQKIPGFIRTAIRGVVELLPVRIGGRGIRITRWAKRFLSFASLSAGEAYMQSYSYYNKEELSALLRSDHHAEINLLHREHEQLFNAKYAGDIVNAMCNTDLDMFLVGLNLTYSDRASMAASVEVRVPFVDKEVVAFAMSIPGALKIRNGESKFILKKVAEKYLPSEIVYRPKAPFGAPIRSWISNELRPMVDDLLSKDNVEKRRIFNYDFVRKLIEDDRNGIADNAYRIYQLLTIELWLREYIDPKI